MPNSQKFARVDSLSETLRKSLLSALDINVRVLREPVAKRLFQCKQDHSPSQGHCKSLVLFAAQSMQFECTEYSNFHLLIRLASDRPSFASEHTVDLAASVPRINDSLQLPFVDLLSQFDCFLAVLDPCPDDLTLHIALKQQVSIGLLALILACWMMAQFPSACKAERQRCLLFVSFACQP